MSRFNRFAPFVSAFFVTVLAVTGYTEYIRKLELKLFGPDENWGPLGVPYTPFWWDTLWICIAVTLVALWVVLLYRLKKLLSSH